MSKLSRRSFLKGTAVSALGAAALGMTACSNNTAASSTASSAAASAPASSTPAQQPAAAETGKPGFFTDPYQYKDTDAVQVVTTEVVVVGAGNAGCTAACSCVENGSEVVVIEAQNAIHGQGGGVGLCNTKYVQSLVDEGKLPHMTDVVEHQNIWIQRCGSRVNEALVSMWFNNSPEAGNWLIDKCAEFGVVPVSFRAHAPNAIIPESYDYHMFVNVGDHQFDSKCGYFAATNVLYEDSQNAEKYEHPATYFFNTKAQELLVEDGRVTGVFAQRDGELWLFRATKGVILATGGIHEDTEMTDYYCDENIKRVQRCEHGPAGFSTGDGHKMGLWVGAHMQDGPFPLMLHPQACSMFHGCFPFVNQEGHRFMNEGTWVQGKSMNVMHQTGNVAWSIFDADYGKYNRMSLENGTGGGMFWDSFRAVGTTAADASASHAKTVKEGVEKTPDNYKVADTIDELLKQLDVDVDEAKKTIERYNEICKKGEDTDFFKESHFLFPIEQGPFYATKVAPGLLAVVGGIAISDNFEVVNAEGEPIKGLYAIGNCSGNMYAYDYPINVQGNSHGRCLVEGKCLGEQLAGVYEEQ